MIIIAYSNRNTVELYVSVSGNDEADGSISDPLATLPVAVDKLRELRRTGIYSITDKADSDIRLTDLNNMIYCLCLIFVLDSILAIH